MSSGDRVFFMQQKSQWIKSKAKEIFWSILSWEPEKVETEISIFSRGIGMHCNALEFIEMHWKEERIKGETLYRMEQLIPGQPVLSTLISGHIFYPLWKFLLSLGRSSRVRKPKDFTGSGGGGLAGESCSLGAEQPPSLPNSL